MLAGQIGTVAPAGRSRLRVPEAGELRPLGSGVTRAATVARLAPLNTRHLFSLLREQDTAGRVRAAQAWADDLRGLMDRHGPAGLSLLSLAMADAHALAASGMATEPIDIDWDTAIASLYRPAHAHIVDRHLWHAGGRDGHAERTMMTARSYRAIPPKLPTDSERVDDLVWRQALAAPDAPAVSGGLTYGELVARAEGLAASLSSVSCGRGTVVGLVLDRSPELLVAMLAVWRIGAACLPIAPTDPPQRVQTLLATVAPPLVVTAGEMTGRLPTDRRIVLVEDSAPAPIADRPQRPATDPAVIFSTSGSTGVPKSVVITHHNYTSQLDWVIGNFELSARDVHLLKAPVSFVSLLRQVIWPLTTGASIVVVPPGLEHDVPRQSRLIDDHGVTFMTFITPALQAFIRHARLDGSSVCNVATGGDRYPLGLARGFFRTFPNARMHHTYGMTEGTLVLCNLIDHPDADESSLGTVVPGAIAKLLDEDREPVPPGGTGEIYIGGVPLTPGYLGRPDLNAERFLSTSDGPLFATRDRARHRSDGTFELVGRADNMVKIRGFRVELGEVEQAIDQHPAVAHAVCRADTAPSGEIRLVAYLQTHTEVADTELRGFLRNTLPDYMVPALFLRLNSFPLTPNGKVKRDELPTPPAAAAPAPQPANLADTVRAEWTRVLDVTDPTPSSDFFDLGGTSMTAMELTASLSEHLGIDVPMTAALRYPTLAQFSTHVEQLAASMPSPEGSSS